MPQKFDISLPEQFRKQIPAKTRKEQALPFNLLQTSLAFYYFVVRKRKLKVIIFCVFLF